MYNSRFGTIACKKKYVTERDVERALAVQKEIEARGEPHKLIGIIMLEMGMLSSTQLLDILQDLEKHKKSKFF